MKNLTLIILLIFSTSLYSQSFYKAELIFTNGDYETGYAKVPNAGKKEVTFKKTLDDDPVKYKSDDLYTITFKTDDGNSYTLERAKSKILRPKKSGEIIIRINNYKEWYFRQYTDNKLNFYSAAEEYKINHKGEFKITSEGESGFTHINYYLRRPSENELTYITTDKSGIKMFHESSFRNVASTYLSDNEDLADRIENKEFKSHEIDDLYNIYISY